MLSLGSHTLESYAYVLNADDTILKLNPALEQLGYQFMWVDASEFELNFSEILNVPRAEGRPLPVRIGREFAGISHELHNAIVHTHVPGPMFLHMEYPGIILLRRLKTFEIQGTGDFIVEQTEFMEFHTFVHNLLVQLRLFKIGELRCSQAFHISTRTRQISLRRREVEIGSGGDFTLSDVEAKVLSSRLKVKYEINALTQLAVENFMAVYDLPNGKVRFITLVTCLESLFNLGKEQIAHTIARHLAIILSNDKSEFLENYGGIKKLYNKRNAIVHGGDYKGDIMQDYLDLSNKVRAAIAFCNVPGLTKEVLFENLNSRGF